MSIRLPTTPEELALVRRWVVSDLGGKTGRYLKLKGVGPLRDRPERSRFEASLAQDARRITDEELCDLLGLEWRARLTAVWLIGLDRRTQFRHKLAELLVNDDGIYLDWGYFFAFARFGEPTDADILVAYMKNQSSIVTRRAHTKPFALDAVRALDEQLGTDHSAEFRSLAIYRERTSTAGSERFPEFEHPITQMCAWAERIMAVSPGS
ncbi:DUF6000 family protein [Nocardia sp. NPDC050406]|uniref:DUF6000 family protein n=1 Tax=Nocardia sp. NPDC050406 TaxID=3364318 RepID=UPI0037A41B2B